MAKIFLISINIIVVFAVKIFFGGEVKVEQKMEDTIRPGQTLNVTLEITKGDRQGFAKWQQRLPAGFIASSVEMNGATFSFKNQEIKVIWMELPASEAFTIQYKIETSSSVSGEHNLLGKFSFIEENERRDINSELFILTIDEAAMADNTGSESETDTTIVPSTESTSDGILDETDEFLNETAENMDETNEFLSEVPENDSSADEIITANTPISTNSFVANNASVTTNATVNNLISITREITHVGEGNYEVSLKVNKSDLASFGKVEEYLPPNYTASPIENLEGIFSFKNNVMKILWMTLPQEERFEVKYALKSTSGELDSASVHGVFSYLNVDESVQNKLAPTKFRNFLAEGQLVEENNESNQNSAATSSNKEGSSTNTNSIVDNSKTVSNNSKSDEQLIENITNIPAPETAVAYKVQIAAAHREVDQRYFNQRHGITETVSIEFHETWYKYTIGAFPIYKQARDKRNQVWANDNKINDAFVTAYNSGDRISVQEALMISKQKWFK